MKKLPRKFPVVASLLFVTLLVPVHAIAQTLLPVGRSVVFVEPHFLVVGPTAHVMLPPPNPSFSFSSVTVSSPQRIMPLSASAAFASVHPHYGSLAWIDQLADSFKSSDTPFASQTKIPLVSILGGRFNLQGFQRSVAMADILWGLPASGSFRALGAAKSHSMPASIPKSEDSYGMQLTLRLGDSAVPPGGNVLAGCLRRTLRSGLAVFSR